jgi:hypothetical protein
MVTFKSLACRSFAREAAIMPLPKDEVTPPVTKIYLAIKKSLPTLPLFFGKLLPLINMTRKIWDKSWRSCKDMVNIWAEEIWEDIIGKNIYFQF